MTEKSNPDDFEKTVADLQGRASASDPCTAPPVSSGSVLSVSATIQKQAEEKRLAEEKVEYGQLMPQGHPHAGWIFCGISPSSGKRFYVAPRDEPGIYKWEEAMNYAAGKNARLPSQEEFIRLFHTNDEGALSGTFNKSGTFIGGGYWTSSSSRYWPFSRSAWIQFFGGGIGTRDTVHKKYENRIRLVRD